MYHFTEASFYWFIFVKKNACRVYHFTGVSFYWGKFVNFRGSDVSFYWGIILLGKYCILILYVDDNKKPQNGLL